MQTDIPSRYIRLAEIAAKMAATIPYQHRHAALIIKNGRILGKGKNSYDTGIHAECSALCGNWASEFKGATMIIVRVMRRQPFGLSRPCQQCLERIRECGIKRIVYSTDNPLAPFAMERI